MKHIPNQSFWKLWNISFGFFGVQIAYALQSANISRIFSTLGADPHNLSYFWILPPLMGIIVQPIIGALSDKTWTRFGRRIPYLFVGAVVAVLVMCMLPNAGSFGMAVSTAMIFGLFSLMFLDTSINVAMQPFKMMVGDMVNEEQKSLAYSIQSFLCNAGSLVGYIFPFVLTGIGISNIAPEGVVPDTVIFSFYAGAAILILCVLYTTAKVKEYPPELYAEYHGIKQEEKSEKTNMLQLLIKAPRHSGPSVLCSSSAGRHLCLCGPTPTALSRSTPSMHLPYRARSMVSPAPFWTPPRSSITPQATG